RKIRNFLGAGFWRWAFFRDALRINRMTDVAFGIHKDFLPCGFCFSANCNSDKNKAYKHKHNTDEKLIGHGSSWVESWRICCQTKFDSLSASRITGVDPAILRKLVIGQMCNDIQD